MIWNKISETSFAIQKRWSLFFEENHIFNEEETPHTVVTVEEELDGVGNLMDLLRLMNCYLLRLNESSKNVGILM